MSHALHFLILTVAGWLQRRMEAHIEYLITEHTQARVGALVQSPPAAPSATPSFR